MLTFSTRPSASAGSVRQGQLVEAGGGQAGPVVLRKDDGLLGAWVWFERRQDIILNRAAVEPEGGPGREGA